VIKNRSSRVVTRSTVDPTRLLNKMVRMRADACGGDNQYVTIKSAAAMGFKNVIEHKIHKFSTVIRTRSYKLRLLLHQRKFIIVATAIHIRWKLINLPPPDFLRC